ncbi:regulator SirB [Pseudomonas aeruginosa]|uniref:SirB2 family protein n=1 Tax=Pseudomonas aeruginosa TaxID=287 RepID=UPI000717B5B8|nr:SirB2 family protein [Pseudomonas aeruginosa]KRU90652.1 regulator SirB [Pseudomonas aeruginosa]KRU97066.1 regulator SirB [Pseudomonas aeruginosa]MBN7867589.1 SirB2 family protein [Pseudomonas aeruginosa]MDA3277672.1 SirB2 family protein [Pseudomonas aeruginosa]MDV7846921.1 SirB2 family protein [Pseudomonas aeruginosa]
MYLWLKTLHITFALSSAALFAWRLAWNWSGRKASGIRRWGPHLVDTLLLLSALGLVHLAMPWPLPLWLQAKLGLLLGYIVCAALALRMARGTGKGLLSILSLALLGGIFYLALNKPWW